MSRRSFLVAVGVVVLFLFTIVAGAWLLLRHEPRLYPALVRLEEEKDRVKCSQEFVKEFLSVYNGIKNGGEWDGRFTDTQVNCYLTEGLVAQGFDRFLPRGISDPRVQFESGRIHICFRYRRGPISTVVSVVVRIWLPAGEPNALAVKLESLKAGLIPISPHWLLQHISDLAQSNGVEVNWYRHEGMPVALVRFEADRPRPTLQLTSARVEDGTITIQGKSTDPNLAGAPRPGVSLAQQK
jgi:hypothetical protein